MAAQTEIPSVGAHRRELAYNRLRRRIADVIENLGRKECAAAFGGKSPDSVRKSLEGDPKRHFPTSDLVALLDLDEEKRVIELLCELAGGDYVPRVKRSLEEERNQFREIVISLGPLGLEAMRKRGLR